VNKITTLGIDLAKHVFHLHAVDERGGTVFSRQVRRAQLRAAVVQIPPCLIGMEACATAHHWAREFEKLGHTVRLMNPHYVQPYVKSQKNDATDAAAICEAVQRPSMRFVAVKSLEQQDLQSAHRARSALVRQRTALISRIKALLAEYGVVTRTRWMLRRELPAIIGDESNGLTFVMRRIMADFHEQLLDRDQRIERCEQIIKELGAQHEVVKRLEEVPGIGFLTATALVAAVADAKSFRNGRQMAAWLGLVPRQASSGGRPRLLGITKRGDKYLRCLLVHGARSMISWGERRQTLHAWPKALLERRGKFRTYVAQANKNARIAWAIMARGEHYRAPSN
jgi:transposase